MTYDFKAEARRIVEDYCLYDDAVERIEQALREAAAAAYKDAAEWMLDQKAALAHEVFMAKAASLREGGK